MKQAKERGTPAFGFTGGPQTSNPIITKYLPKLTETILEVFSEEPFQGQGSITPLNGVHYKFNGEQLLLTLINFSLRVFGGYIEKKRKIWIEIPDSPV